LHTVSVPDAFTKAQKEPQITGLQAREHHQAWQEAPQQGAEEFHQQYAARAGIEGTQ
jgi:hypothetical protein